MSRPARPAGRFPLLFLGMLSLLGGVLAGLARLDWPVPALAAQAAGVHAPLMIAAFFGTVIGLERAVALGQGWTYLAPLTAGASGIALLTGLPHSLGQSLGGLAAAVLVAASGLAWRRQPALHTGMLTLAAACWLAGHGLWMVSGSPETALRAWFLFLILTIAGERLELTRFLPTPPVARRLFVGIVTLLLAGIAPGAGQLYAAGLLALASWLLRYDIARRNRHGEGLTRFIALCLLSGYGWLAIAGLLGLAGAFDAGHPWRDPALHAIGLGFVFAMVFGHALIIFPAVTGLRIPYRPIIYLPLALLHVTLALRVAGSLADHPAFRQWGGLLNGVVLIVFIATMARLALSNRQGVSLRQ